MDQRGPEVRHPRSKDYCVNAGRGLKAVIDTADPRSRIVGHSMGASPVQVPPALSGRVQGSSRDGESSIHGDRCLEEHLYERYGQHFYPSPLALLVLVVRNRWWNGARERLRNTSVAYLICRWPPSGRTRPADEVDCRRDVFTTSVPTTSGGEACFIITWRSICPTWMFRDHVVGRKTANQRKATAAPASSFPMPRWWSIRTPIRPTSSAPMS